MRLPVSTTLALAIVIFARPGDASVRFVGAAECGSCHAAEFDEWRRSPHAVALSRLSKAESADARCRGCHTMAPAERDVALEGVQCEACHGAGRHYAPAHVMKDPMLRDLLGLEKIDAKTCANCHRSDTPGIAPFDFAAKVGLVSHGSASSTR